MLSSNPILNKKSFYTAKADSRKTFSISSAIHKSLLLLSFIILVAAATWYYGMAQNNIGKNLIALSGVLAFVTAVVIRYKREWASCLVLFMDSLKVSF